MTFASTSVTAAVDDQHTGQRKYAWLSFSSLTKVSDILWGYPDRLPHEEFSHKIAEVMMFPPLHATGSLHISKHAATAETGVIAIVGTR